MDKTKLKRKKLTLSIILFILLILILTLVKENIEEISGLKERKLESIGQIDLKWNKGMTIKGYKKEILVLDDKKLISYDYHNKKKWSKDINKNEEIYLSENEFFINNKQKYIVTKFDTKGTSLWSYQSKFPIYTIDEIGGHVFIYAKVDEATRSITILDKSGKLVFDEEKNKEEILSASISLDKKSFIITSMDTASPDLKSNLTYLDKDGEVIWTKELEGKMIYKVLYLKEDNMLLVGDTEMICKDREGKTLWERKIKYNLKDIRIIDKEKIYTLYGNNDTYLEILNVDGKVSYKKTFKKEYEHIEPFKESVLLIGKEGLLGLTDEKINMKYDLKADANSVDKIDDKILIVRKDKIEIFKIVDKKIKKD